MVSTRKVGIRQLHVVRGGLVRAAVLSSVAMLVCFGQQQQPGESQEPSRESSGEHISIPAQPNKPRVFLQSSSHGNNWNASRDQSMEMSKDFEKECPQVRVTVNQSMADYTVILNHIEHGLARDNQFQVADKNGDLLTHQRRRENQRRRLKSV
jgi:hypothetical protein